MLTASARAASPSAAANARRCASPRSSVLSLRFRVHPCAQAPAASADEFLRAFSVLRVFGFQTGSTQPLTSLVMKATDRPAFISHLSPSL